MGDPEEALGQAAAMEESDDLSEIIRTSMNTVYQVPNEQSNINNELDMTLKKRKNNENIEETNSCKQIIYSLHSHPESNQSNIINNNQSHVSPNSSFDKNNSSTPSEYNSFYLKCAENRYAALDGGPLYIYAETNNNSRLHPMNVGKIIRNNNFNLYKNITSIKSIGRSRVKILIKANYKEINNLIEERYWSTHNIVCYVPSFYMFKQGVIRDVDTSLSENEVINYSISEVMVVQAKRIYKMKEIEGKGKVKVPTPVVILSFRGPNLPKDIKLLGVKCNVETYIQKVIQCYTCLRYGHTSRICKNSPRCEKCGSLHETQTCTEELNCIFCKAPHRSTDRRTCPEFKRQEAIKKIMTEENMTFPEAADCYKIKNIGSYADKAKDKNYTHTQTPPPPPISQYPPLVRQSPLQEVEDVGPSRTHPRREPEIVQAMGRNNPQYRQVKTGHIEGKSRNQAQGHVTNNLHLPSAPIINSQIYKSNIIQSLMELVMSNINKIIMVEYPSLSSEHLTPTIQPLVFKAISESFSTMFINKRNTENSLTDSEDESV